MLSLRPRSKSKVDQIGLLGKFLINAVPPKWIVLSEDRYLDPQQYAALFSKVGYKFGRNAQDYFLLPKLDNTTAGLGYFLKICGAGETIGQRIVTSERPRHQHTRSMSSDGSHSQTFPTNRYLRGSVISGRANKNGTGYSYAEPSTLDHGSHSHSDSSSGTMTAIALSNRGTVSAPPAVEVVMAIYAGV